LCKQVDGFLEEKGRVASPLLKVQWFERGQEWIERLNGLQKKINMQRDALLEELKTMNAPWQSNAPREQLPLKRLDEIYRLLGYFGRWSAQLQERVVQLSFD